MSFQSTIYYLREYFFPAGCAVCGKALSTADARYGLCEKCRAAFGIALVTGRRCRYCGKPLITERGTCLSCRGKEVAESGRYNDSIKKLRVLFPYVGKFRTTLGAYKFGRSTGVGIFFARCLELSLQDLDPEAFGRQVLEPELLEKTAWVPVPPRPGKLKQQGWDQVEYLARLMGKTHGKTHGKAVSPPVKRCLKRLPSKSQKVLNREERLLNLSGRIRCVKKPPDTAILFDDVITTGATVDACAAALLKAGAKRVYAVCLFYR